MWIISRWLTWKETFKKSKQVEPFEHMQTTRFGNQPAYHRTFEVLFHHLFVCFFSDKCETATKARNISRHVEKHFRGKLQSNKLLYQRTSTKTSGSRKKKKKKKITHKKKCTCRQRGLKNQACVSSYVWRSLPPFIYLSIYLFVFIYWPFSLFGLAVQLKLSIPQDCCS